MQEGGFLIVNRHRLGCPPGHFDALTASKYSLKVPSPLAIALLQGKGRVITLFKESASMPDRVFPDIAHGEVVYYLRSYSLVYSSTLRCYPPSPQRQSLDPHDRGLDVPPKCNHANNDTKYVDNIVAIGCDIARSTAVNTAVLLMFQCAGERLRDEWTLEQIGFGWHGRRSAGRGCEHVDCFEDEEAREGAAEVGYTVGLLV